MNKKLLFAAAPTLMIVAALLILGWPDSGGEGRASPEATAIADSAAPMPPDVPTSVRPLKPYPDAVRVELYAIDKTWTGKEYRINQEWVRPLTKDRRAAFEANLSIAYYEKGKAVAACCFPHHFLRYFDSKGRQLGEVGICFCCGCVTTDVGGPLRDNEYREFDYAKMKALIEGLGVPTDMGCH